MDIVPGIIEGINNKTKCVDDTVMWSEDIAQASTDAANYLAPMASLSTPRSL
jgi:hypothetical protein